MVFDARKEVSALATTEAIDRYFVALVSATRNPGKYDKDLGRWIHVGASPRGTLALRRAAQAVAAGEDRTFVVPDDIKAVSVAVLAHRLKLKTSGFNGHSAQAADDVVRSLVGQVAIPT